MDGQVERARDRGISVDLVVPVRNEATNIEVFLASIDALPLPPDVALSVIFVEDGSSDATMELLREISQADARVRFYSLEKGFGEGPAIVFGISRSSADAVIMLAVESHPPELIPEMVEAFRNGAEVVQCIRDDFAGRDRRRDALTALFPAVVRLLTGVDYSGQNVYYRLVSRDFARRILETPRFWRFVRFPLPDPASGSLAVLHADMLERERGESEYGVLRLVALGADGILAWMSAARFFILMLAGAALAGWLAAAGVAPIAAVLAALQLLVAGRFLWIRNTDYLKKIVVKESSDAGR